MALAATEIGNPLGLPPHMSGDDLLDIKSNLPLEWVIGYLWGLWGVGKTRVSCPNGDHGDSTPSFNLWAPDKNGYFTKFGCYGCGIRGDVIDVIRMHFQVGFHEAMDIAMEKLIPEFQQSEYTPGQDLRPTATLDDVRVAYDDLLSYGHDPATLVRFQNTKLMLTLGPYPHAEWRWSGHKIINGVSMPHYNQQDELIGVKLRDKLDLGRKWGIRGSRYTCLYGAWRDRGREKVLVCEGESDTVWAAWHLRRYNIDVLGLPTGAAQQPVEAGLAQLADRQVYLAFDGDPAGHHAAEVWAEKLGRPTILEVPENHDLMSSGLHLPPLVDLGE